MRIGPFARSLGVPVPTLRRWTEEFADFLGEGARGGDGRSREFSTRDSRILRRVRDLLAEGDVTYAQVRRRLADEGHRPDRPPDDSGKDAEPSAAERAAAEGFVAAIVDGIARDWWRRIERLEAEIAELRAELAAKRTTAEPPAEESVLPRRRWPFS